MNQLSVNDSALPRSTAVLLKKLKQLGHGKAGEPYSFPASELSSHGIDLYVLREAMKVIVHELQDETGVIIRGMGTVIEDVTVNRDGTEIVFVLGYELVD